MAAPEAHADLAGLFEEARAAHAAGALEAAAEGYRAMLARAPDHAEAMTFLASAAYGLGRDDEARRLVDGAIASYRRRLLARPNDGPLRAALANLLLARDSTAAAAAVLSRAVLPLYPVRADAAAFDARKRAARAAGLPGILINALPKSASESIWNRLAEGLGLAQAHVSIGLFPDCLVVPYRARELARGGIAAKEHLAATAANLEALAAAGVRKLVVHVRDPRQATLSWAHFLEGDVRKRLLAPLWRRTTPPAAFFGRPFAEQLDWHIAHYLPIAVAFIADWLAAAGRHGIEVVFLDFETFRSDPDRYFAELLAAFAIPPERFARDVEAEVVHLRKGRLDEWREVFSAEQAARAWAAIPPPLAERFGWRP